MRFLLTMLGLALLGLPNAQAQRRANSQFIPFSEVGLGGGSSFYLGELSPPSQAFQSFSFLPRWNLGGSFTRHFNPHFSARASLMVIRLAGDDYSFNKDEPNLHPIQFQRNLHFRNDLKELALSGLYQFIPEGRRTNQRPSFTPYLTLGVALVAHNPKARAPVNADGSLADWVALQPLGTEGQGLPGYAKPYSLLTVAIPAGAGLRWQLTESLNLAAEISFRYTFTDYLDDISGLYPNPGDLPSGLSTTFSDRRAEPIAARTGDDRTKALSTLYAVPTEVRRGLAGNDYYILTQLSIHYLIPPSIIKCPVFRR
ncbi:hypothetical protein GO730_36940 [Spirosoma sp. HMF3257]|uniref:Outer membrane beta-barrel protein n=1 Tax=Spirosoma telluris TaxID=2183553 RepID=A0A327NU47_9BACT|nr:hypothetical protein [Spirosoma telluris]RAI78255.1 hypothetical protein HMF3257_36870 [Spirosoma telluris]